MNWNHSHCLHVGRVMLSSSQSAIDVAYASLSACVAYSPLCPLPGLCFIFMVQPEHDACRKPFIASLRAYHFLPYHQTLTLHGTC